MPTTRDGRDRHGVDHDHPTLAPHEARTSTFDAGELEDLIACLLCLDGRAD